MPAAFNAANEVAVGAFLAGQITFGRIASTIDAVLTGMASNAAMTIDSVRATDTEARRLATAAVLQ